MHPVAGGLLFWCALHSVLVCPANAQRARTYTIDSLVIARNLYQTYQSFYVRPLAEMHYATTQVQGNAHYSPPTGDLMRVLKFGLRAGYRTGPVEIETGLSSTRVGAGFKFVPEYGTASLMGMGRSTDYAQIPLVVRYRLWQPTRRFALRAGAGIAFNIDLNRVSLSRTGRLTELLFNPDGTSVPAAYISSQYTKVRRFWSAEVNLSVSYQLSRRFSLALEGKRLIGFGNVVTMDVRREVLLPTARVDAFSATGSANGYNLNLGLQYQFGFRNRYRLRSE